MCMRPCGPVRSGGYREPKEITKKETFGILSEGDFESIDLYNNGVGAQYDGSLSKVRVALRSCEMEVEVVKSWHKEYKEGYRSIAIQPKWGSGDVWVIRRK